MMHAESIADGQGFCTAIMFSSSQIVNSSSELVLASLKKNNLSFKNKWQSESSMDSDFEETGPQEKKESEEIPDEILAVSCFSIHFPLNSYLRCFFILSFTCVQSLAFQKTRRASSEQQIPGIAASII